MNTSLNFEELKEFLDEKVEKFNCPGFIENDPIQIPHRFSLKEDIEIAGFLTSTIAWGRREMIIKNADLLMELMDNSPYDFIMNHEELDLAAFDHFVHRTFQSSDIKYFLKRLQQIYKEGGLEPFFTLKDNALNQKENIANFNEAFFKDVDAKFRTRKHVANPNKGSSAKRICMYLRWMVRPNNTGVDFGIWKSVPLSKLSCPLDVHTGNVGRSLGFINRNQNDWKAVEELDTHLRKLDPNDPVKYDFALFGLGVDEGWK